MSKIILTFNDDDTVSFSPELADVVSNKFVLVFPDMSMFIPLIEVVNERYGLTDETRLTYVLSLDNPKHVDEVITGLQGVEPTHWKTLWQHWQTALQANLDTIAPVVSI